MGCCHKQTVNSPFLSNNSWQIYFFTFSRKYRLSVSDRENVKNLQIEERNVWINNYNIFSNLPDLRDKAHIGHNQKVESSHYLARRCVRNLFGDDWFIVINVTHIYARTSAEAVIKAQSFLNSMSFVLLILPAINTDYNDFILTEM